MTTDAGVVLAAGKGTRMASRLPKVLHPLAGTPMLVRILRTLAQVGFERPSVLIGYGADRIRRTAGDRCDYVLQDEQLGTGHAARLLLDALPASVKRIILVHGDEPLIPADMLREMMALQAHTGSPVVLLTAHVQDTLGFGRVIRDDAGHPCALLQESSLTPEQRHLDEVNLGAYVFDADFLREVLPGLPTHQPKGEYYLTDVIDIAAERAVAGNSAPVEAVVLEGGEALMGVNDLVQLERAGRVIYAETNRRHMERGVTIVDSASTFIDEDVEIGPDTTILPFSVISGATVIGTECTIGPHSHIVDTRIGDRCRVISSMLEESTVANGVRIGPYAHLRPGADIGEAAEIGNYAEIKKSTIGPRTRMHHMSYVGDAQIGTNVNIGAGTVTCNYDGKNKHGTIVEDNAFIGSDTMRRAPVRVGEGAMTGAGTVVTKDVPPRTVVAGVPGRVLREIPEAEESEETDRRRGVTWPS